MDRRKKNNGGAWLALCIGAGVALGAALGNLAVGIGLGAGLGGMMMALSVRRNGG
ncbi:hypothetical protein [Luteimonas gilva]|uniref:hypothetical protein n=1 Tax=Luteimonas gilva TaxID=2572684 RepID=UPI001672AC86|nr:hypothetical protein [Luteimonas gilva]